MSPRDSRPQPFPPTKGTLIAIQDDSPLPAWICGTFVMITTLHLLLGNKHPHALPSGYMSREHMLALYKFLLKWLLTGSPPSLWEDECMRPDIGVPPSANPAEPTDP